jgi:hypothetical protein
MVKLLLENIDFLGWENWGRGPKLPDKSQNNMKAGDGAAPLRKQSQSLAAQRRRHCNSVA